MERFHAYKAYLTSQLIKGHILIDFTYFTDYFTTWEAIKSGNVRVIARYRLYQVLLLLSGLNSALYFFYQNSWSHLTNLISCNIIYITGLKAEVNLWLVFMYLLSVLFFDLLYFQNSGISSQWLYAILIKKQPQICFLYPISHPQKLNSLPLVTKIRNIALFTRNQYQLVYLCNLIVFLQAEAVIFEEFYNQNYFYNPNYYVAFLSYQMALLVRICALNLFQKSQIITVILGYLNMCIAQIRFGQIELYINSIHLSRFNRFHLRTFLQLKVQTLRYLLDSNRIYGRALFFYLIISSPSNAAFIMLLTYVPLATPIKLVFCILILAQLAVVFLVHFVCALLTVKLHKPAKRMMAFYLSSRQLPDLISRWKLAVYIEQFHSTKPYALQYGRFGNISFASFGKHLFLYCKYLIFCHKIMQKF